MFPGLRPSGSSGRPEKIAGLAVSPAKFARSPARIASPRGITDMAKQFVESDVGDLIATVSGSSRSPFSWTWIAKQTALALDRD
jgi:hypothetical protein